MNFCFSLCGLCVLSFLPLQGASLSQKDLFVSGTDSYHTFRIPSLIVSKSGALLAFAEGRKHSSSDTGDIDLVLRRSTDHGRSWSPLQTVWDDGPNTCGNPCSVLDAQTGTIWLLMTHNLGFDSEAQIVNQTSKGTRSVWISHSTDEGVTWSKPREITSEVKRPEWTWYATGPGIGIQMKSDRLVIPCDHIEAKTKAFYSHVIYSDDHGASWKLGGRMPQPYMNECQIVQLAEGSLMLNMRNYTPNARARAISVSHDSGLTWSEPRPDPALIEPICQASLVRHTFANGIDALLFSNPASQQKRVRITVRLSSDGGQTWPHGRLLNEGPSAYSCLAVLPDERIACLYERGEKNPYERISLAIFPLEWLKPSP